MRDKVTDVTSEAQECWEHKNYREIVAFAHSWTPEARESPTGSTDEHSVVSGIFYLSHEKVEGYQTSTLHLSIVSIDLMS